MPWTDTQKQIAVRAARAAGLSDENRKLVLLQLPNSKFDRHGKPTGEASSTSARLNQSDFEQFMAYVERWAGGRVLDYDAGYWACSAGDGLARFRHRITRLVNTLELEGHLEKDGVGLRGWIDQRVKDGAGVKYEDLSYTQLRDLHLGLLNYGRRHGLFKHAS